MYKARHLFFLLLLFGTTNVYTMENMPVIAWAHPNGRERSFDQTVFHTPAGVRALQKLIGKPSWQSHYAALDIADCRTPTQCKAQVAALLDDSTTENLRVHLLKKTFCTQTALGQWRKSITRQPLQPKDVAEHETPQTLLAASQLPTALKNQYLHETVPPVAVSQASNYCEAVSSSKRYAVASNPYCFPSLIDLIAGKVLSYKDAINYRNGHISSGVPIQASSDNTCCIFEDRDTNTSFVFNIAKNKIITLPVDAALLKFLPFSKRLLLQRDHQVTIFDISNEKKSVLPIDYDENQCLVSPNEQWAFFRSSDRNDEDFLVNLQQQRLIQYSVGCNSTGLDIHWAPSSAYCLIPHYDQIHSQPTAECPRCDNQPGRSCGNGDVHEREYRVFDLNTHRISYAVQNVNFRSCPVFSDDGRYFYCTHLDGTGSLHDMHTQQKIATFENVRASINELSDIDYGAVFSKDPAYPYCIITLRNQRSEQGYNSLGLKVIVYDLQKREIVKDISDLDNVFLVTWPKRGPYFFAEYSKPVTEPLPTGYYVNYYPAVEVRDKKTHRPIAYIDNADNPSGSADGRYCAVEVGECCFLIDMVNQQVMRRIHNMMPLAETFFDNGMVYELKGSTLYRTAPPDPNYNALNTNQILFMLHAYHRCKDGKPLDLTEKEEEPLRRIFKSLDKYMQGYVAKACFIKTESERGKEEEDE